MYASIAVLMCTISQKARADIKMIRLPHLPLACIIIYFSATTCLAADQDREISDWLPECFEDQNALPFGMISCVRDHSFPDCFDDTSNDSIESCVDNAVTMDPPTLDTIANLGDYLAELLEYHRNVVNAMDDCMESYSTCVQEQMEEYVNDLNSCVNETLQELADCAEEHQDACQDACESVTADDVDMAWQDVDASQVETCDELQTNVFDSICSIVDCCEPCLAKQEAVWNCIATQVLDYTTTTPAGSPCIACPLTSKRRRRQLVGNDENAAAPRSLTQESNNNDVLFDACADLTPGVTGNTADGPGEMTRRSQFFSCVSDGFHQELATVSTTTTTTDATTTTTTGGQPTTMGGPTPAMAPSGAFASRNAMGGIIIPMLFMAIGGVLV